VILSTTETLEKLNIFIEKFKVNNYPFVFIGKDYKYELGRVFQPKTIPVLVFYNKAAKFKAINQGQVSKKQLLKWLKEQNNN
jgi:hypothetical protein